MTETSVAPAYPFRRHPTAPPDEYRLLRVERPVGRVTLWNGAQPWLVTRFDDVRAVLGDPRFSSVPTNPGYPILTPSIAASKKQDGSFIRKDRPEHSEQRRMWTKYFAVKRVEEMRPDIQRIVDDSLAAMIAHGSPADLVENFALPVPSQVICRLLDVPYEDHEFFQKHSQTRVASDATFEEVTEANRALREYWVGLITARQADPRDDMISKMIVEEIRGGSLTSDQLVEMAQLMLFAGHETTANMIALGTLTLLQHPGQLAAFKADPSLAPGLVDELMRYTSIVHFSLSRAAVADVVIGAELIRAGEGVILAIPSANRDESAFAGEPDEFDLFRNSRHHLGFGYGMHQCLGAALARVELQIVFDTLFQRLPELRLAVAEDELVFKPDNLFYGVAGLPVAW